MHPKRLGYGLIAALLILLVGNREPVMVAQSDTGLGSAGHPLNLPADSNTLLYSAAPEASAWVRVPTMKKNGRGRALPMAIAVKQRSHWVGANAGLDELRSVRFTSIRFADDGGNHHDLSLDSIATGGSPDGGASDVDFEDIESAAKAAALPPPDWRAAFRLSYQHRNRLGKAEATRVPVLVVWQVYTDGGESFDTLQVGPQSYVWRAKEPYQRAAAFVEAQGLKATEFATPDLFVCLDGAPQVGEVQFVPLGDFEFASVPMVVRAFSGAGTDLLATGALTLGEAELTPRGEVRLPVKTVREVIDLVLIVRGVKIFINPDAGEETIQCYTVGGAAVARGCANVAPVARGTRLLDNWESARAPQCPDLGRFKAPLWDEERKQVTQEYVGTDWPRATVRGEAGYLTGITVFDTYDPSLTTGRMVIRPIWGWKFVRDSNTRLYAATWTGTAGLDLSAEVSATVVVDTNGSVVIDLTKVPEGTINGVNLVLVNPRIEVSAKPVEGQVLQFNVSGGAVPSPVRKNAILQWSINAAAIASASPALPSKPPANVREWSPVALMSEK